MESSLSDDKKEYLRNIALYSTKWFFIWSFRIGVIGIMACIAIAVFIGMSVKEAGAKND